MSKTRDLANLADLNFDSGTMVVDKVNDRVGIGTSSPDAKLSLPAQASGDGVARIAIESAVDNNDFTIAQYEDGVGTYTQIGQNVTLNSGGSTVVLDSGHRTASILFDGRGNGSLLFQTGGTNVSSEAARLDASGNLLVGKTSVDYTTVGFEATPSSAFQANAMTADGKKALLLARKTTDGSIVEFRKDSTAVGSIGVEGGDLVLGTGTNCGIQFNDGNTAIRPFNMASNSPVDNAVSLGISNNRFKDLYLSGGVYLGGTGSANYLDDYEEGTWTPLVTGSTTTFSTSTSTGAYTKVGRLVTLSCTVQGITGSDTGYLRVYVPFTKRSSGTNFQGTVRLESFNWPAGYTWCVPEFTTTGSSSAFYFRLLGDNLGGQDLDSSYVTSGSSRFMATITYETT